jgi:predicted membrane channel-forming protein YqfA (hemolysin III family)
VAEQLLPGQQEQQQQQRGAGGTPGGIGEFLVGLVMAVAGAYLLTSQVTVTSGLWALWGYDTFGLSLVPLIAGVGIVFFNGRSLAGWILTLVGVVIILAGIIANLHIYFQPTSLFNTIVMLVLLAGGLGLVARSVQAR